METSLFLARIIGPLMVLVSISLLTQTGMYRAMLRDISSGNSLLLFISGLMSYTMGILIVLTHNVWEWSGFVLITIIGYLALLKGIILMFFPDVSIGMAKSIVSNESALRIAGVVWLVVSLYICYLGLG